MHEKKLMNFLTERLYFIIIIIVYDARRQQNHTDETPKTQNYTTVYK